MEINELREILTVQRELYAFLSRIITKGPQEEVLSRFICTYKGIADDEHEKDELIKGIVVILNTLEEQSLSKQEPALKNEYTRLFIGPGKCPVPPYASVYLSKELKPKLMDESTIEVRKQYLQDHIIMENLNVVPDDYLGAELEYMNYLAHKSVEAIENQNLNELNDTLEKQLNFIQNHVVLWIPKFSDCLLSSTEEDFFKGMALLLKGLILSHYSLLKEIHNVV